MAEMTKLDQAAMQRRLAEVAQVYGLSGALDALYDWSVQVGYLYPERLAENILLHSWSARYQQMFRIQLNVVRSRYQPLPPSKNLADSPIDFAWVASEERPLLRAYECTLRGVEYFFQLTPFPLGPKHFVCIQRSVSPMRMDANTVLDLLALVRQLPRYMVISNSDIAWAGASVLHHHHYQLLESYQLPIMRARWLLNGVMTECWGAEAGQFGFLDHPAACVKLRSKSVEWVAQKSIQVLTWWRAHSPLHTANVVMRYVGSVLECYLLLRHPDFRTQPSEQVFKPEGVGYIELAGEAIFPVPKGENAPRLWAELYAKAHAIHLRLIRANSPLPEQAYLAYFQDLCQFTMQPAQRGADCKV